MIELPPNTTSPSTMDEISEKLTHEEVVDAISKINDEYLYWSDVKYRAYALDMLPNELWEIVKFVR